MGKFLGRVYRRSHWFFYWKILEMTFTDDDLKRLKHYVNHPDDPPDIISIDYRALLARLEESEHFVTKAVDSYPHLKDSDVYRKWRESCGR